MGYMLSIDEDDVSELADILSLTLEHIICNCEHKDEPSAWCTGNCLTARIIRGREVLINARN